MAHRDLPAVRAAEARPRRAAWGAGALASCGPVPAVRQGQRGGAAGSSWRRARSPPWGAPGGPAEDSERGGLQEGAGRWPSPPQGLGAGRHRQKAC